MNNKYICVMVKLTKEEKKELDEKLKQIKLSRRQFILKALKELNK